jgi:hypothetical protein
MPKIQIFCTVLIKKGTPNVVRGSLRLGSQAGIRNAAQGIPARSSETRIASTTPRRIEINVTPRRRRRGGKRALAVDERRPRGRAVLRTAGQKVPVRVRNFQHAHDGLGNKPIRSRW